MGSDGSIKIAIKAVDQASQNIRKIKDSFSSVTGPAKELASSYRSVKRELEPLIALSGKYGDKLKSFGTKVSVGIGAPTALAAKSIFDISANYEETMLRIEQVTKNKAGFLDELSAKFRGLGRDTQFDPPKIASGGMQLADANFSKQEIGLIIPNVLNTAVANNIDMDLAGQLVASLTKAFKDTDKGVGENSRFIADKITALKQSSQVKINEQYKDALKNVVGYAVTQGITFSDLNASFGLMGEMLSEGGEAGTALKIGMERLISPTSEAVEALGRLNIDPSEFMSKEGGIKSFGAVIKAFSGLDLKKHGADIKEIFGGDASSKWLAIFHQGYAKYQELKKVQDQSTDIDPENKKMGASTDAANIFKDSSRGKYRQLGSAVSELQLAFGDAGFLQDITGGIESVTEGINYLSSTSEGTKRLVGNVAALAAVFGTVAIGGGVAIKVLGAWSPVLAILGLKSDKSASKVIDGSKKSVGAVRRMGRGFIDLGKKSGPFLSEISGKFLSFSKGSIAKGSRLAVSSLKWLAGGIRLVTKASLGFLMNPVVLGFAALAALIAGGAYLIYKNWDKIGPMLTSAKEALIEFWEDSKKTVGEWSDYIMGIPDDISERWNKLKNIFLNLGKEIKEMVKDWGLSKLLDWGQSLMAPEILPGNIGPGKEIGLKNAVRQQESVRESIQTKEISLNIAFKNPPKGMITQTTNPGTKGFNLDLGATI